MAEETTIEDFPHWHADSLLEAREIAWRLRQKNPDQGYIILYWTDRTEREYRVVAAEACAAARAWQWWFVETAGVEFPDWPIIAGKSEIPEQHEADPEKRRLSGLVSVLHDHLQALGFSYLGGSTEPLHHTIQFFREGDADLLRLLLVQSGTFTADQVAEWPMSFYDEEDESAIQAAIGEDRHDAGLVTSLGVPYSELQQVLDVLASLRPISRRMRRDRRWDFSSPLYTSEEHP
jgi:hypothetical protein